MNKPADLKAAMSAVPIPMAMLAELTHRCPLKCPYCSNPLELIKAKQELSTDEWIDVRDLETAAAVYKRVAVNWLGRES